MVPALPLAAKAWTSSDAGSSSQHCISGRSRKPPPLPSYCRAAGAHALRDNKLRTNPARAPLPAGVRPAHFDNRLGAQTVGLIGNVPARKTDQARALSESAYKLRKVSLWKIAPFRKNTHSKDCLG